MNNFCYNIYSWYYDIHSPTFDMDDKTFDRRASNIIVTCEILLWVIGILNNLMNVVIFRHKNMGRNPINLIFWWLSISDLLELVIVALHQRYSWYVGSGVIDIILYFNFKDNIYDCVLTLIFMYLVQVVHTITIGLNIVIIFYQYMVVAHPLRNQNNPLDDQFTKLAVMWVYILSFVLYLPFWYIHEIGRLPLMGILSPWHIKLRGRTDSIYNYVKSDDFSVYICILVCGVILRIGPLIILVTLCARLHFAIKNTHRNRQNLGLTSTHLSKAQRKVNRMNVTIILIVIMFLITEIPLALSSIFMLSYDLFYCSYFLDRSILFPFILLNCCYNTFCYLIRIKQYRETFKLLLSKSNWFSSRARVVEQTELELNHI